MFLGESHIYDVGVSPKTHGLGDCSYAELLPCSWVLSMGGSGSASRVGGAERSALKVTCWSRAADHTAMDSGNAARWWWPVEQTWDRCRPMGAELPVDMGGLAAGPTGVAHSHWGSKAMCTARVGRHSQLWDVSWTPRVLLTSMAEEALM